MNFSKSLIVKLIPLLLLLAVTAPLSAFSQAKGASTAESLLKSSAAKLRAAKCLHILYTATADGQSHPGELTIQGGKFTLFSEGMRTWFDGKTQWTYSPHIGEVNVVTPTPDELRQINPILLLETFSSDYKAAFTKPGSTDKVTLTPLKKGGDIVKAELTIDPSTLYPTRIDITLSNRQTLGIAISSIRAVKALPASAFRFEKSRMPGIPVVDLR